MWKKLRRGFRVGIGPIDLRIRWSFLVTVGLAGASLRDPKLILWWIGIITLCVLVHEAGHAIALLAFNQPCRIELMWLGGATVTAQRTLGPLREIVVFLAGPLAGLSLGALVWAMDPLTSTKEEFAILQAIWLGTIVLNILNLLPVVPLDGGQIMRELIAFKQPQRAPMIAAWISIAMAIGILVYASQAELRGAWPIFIVLFAAIANFPLLGITRSQRRRNEARALIDNRARLTRSERERLLELASLPYALTEGELTELAWDLVRDERFDQLPTLLRLELAEPDASYLRALYAWYRADLATAHRYAMRAMAASETIPPLFIDRCFRRFGEWDRFLHEFQAQVLPHLHVQLMQLRERTSARPPTGHLEGIRSRSATMSGHQS